MTHYLLVVISLPDRVVRIACITTRLWRELLNSDAVRYGGSGVGNLGGVDAAPVPSHGRFHSLALTVPPLATVFLKPEPR